MNIEIRVWDSIEEKMIYSVEDDCQEDNLIFWFDKRNKDDEIDDIMLYSTLKDDNGVKIYADDIVKVWNKKETKAPYLSYVKVDLALGTLIDPHPDHLKMGVTYPRQLSDYINDEKYMSCEVVGNRFEHDKLVDELEDANYKALHPEAEETSPEEFDHFNTAEYFEKIKKQEKEKNKKLNNWKVRTRTRAEHY